MDFSLPFSTSSAIQFLPFLLLLCGFLLTKSKRNSNKKRMPPSASGAWPIIGHLHIFKTQIPAHITLAKMAEKYGPIFTIKLGLSRALIVSNKELAKECLSTNDKVFATRPKSVAFEHLCFNYAMFAFSPYGPYWRHARKITTVQLLSAARLAKFEDVRQREVAAWMKDIHERWEKNKDGSSNKVMLEMDSLLGDLVLNLMFLMIVGKRYVEYNKKNDDSLKEPMRKFNHFIGGFFISDMFPYLKWLDIDGQEGEMKKTGKAMNDMAEEWLEEHKRKECGEGNEEKDFMDILLSILQVEKIPEFDADTINKATCLNLIVAAHEATTLAMVWVIAVLVNNQESLKKAQHELDTKIGRQRRVMESDMKNLDYLQSIIKEAMRLYTVAPLLLPHESMEDCVVGGYHIPKGTRLMVNTFKIHRDPEIWSDPEEFKPERFLTVHKDTDMKGRNFEYLPFGSGRRICPGASLGHRVMELTVANLVHGFDITTPFGEPIDMNGRPGITYLKATPLEVLLSPRLPAHLYE